jgi:hypothetical protein
MARNAGMSAGERAAMGQAGRAKMDREFAQEIIQRAYLDALIRAGVHPA